LGWIASVLPLIVVNICGALGVLSWDDAFIASAVALLAGPLLGGLVAGYLAGRPDRSRSSSTSGARAASLTGAVVAALYFLSVLGLVVYALRPETIPATVQEHPVRSALAVTALAIFALSAVGVAFFIGAWFDRHTYQVAYESYTAKMRALNAQKPPNASRPAAPAPGSAGSPGSSLRDWRERAQPPAHGGYPSGVRREDDAAPRREPWRSR
jgi:MFS family permease